MINFVIRLLILTNWKSKTYNSILIIINWLIKIIYYKLVKNTINTAGLAKVTFNMIVLYHSLLNSIILDKNLVFISKFWLLFYYFFNIKQKLLAAFYLQINGQIKWQNSIIKAYFWVFINFKQNNKAKFLTIAKFAYNNIKNARTGHILFELNYSYHSWMLY